LFSSEIVSIEVVVSKSIQAKNRNFMKGIYVFMTVCLFSMSLTAQEKVFVNDALAQERKVPSFSEISVASSIDLFLSPDDKEVVVVSAAEPGYRDRIITRVEGNQLKIYFDYKGFGHIPVNMKMKAYVSFRTLSRIIASGSSDVYVNGIIKSDRLHINLSGSSDFRGAVDVGDLSFDQSGSSDSQVSGRAEKLAVGNSGASDFKGFALVVNYCKVHVSGSSYVQITVNKEISVEASGASDVEYKGSAMMRDVQSSGASSVSRKG
jgi:hypothetical protein